MKSKNVGNLTSQRMPGKKEQVVRLHLEGVPVMEIVALSKLSFPTVRKTINLYETGGWQAALAGRPGRPAGDGRHLTPAQEQRIRDMVCRHSPHVLGLSAALWNRVALGQLVERETGSRLSPRGLDNYIARWGLAVGGFTRKVCDSCPTAIRAWLAQVYPHLVEETKARGGEVYWASSQDVRLPKIPRLPPGEPAGVCELNTCRMLAAVSNRKLFRWTIVTHPVGRTELIAFFEALLRDAQRYVLLVIEPEDFPWLDQVEDWLAAHGEQIRVVAQPGCRLLPPGCQGCHV